MYIQIGNTKYECKATTFTTQSGTEAVRVVSDAPVATHGFLLLNSNEELIADRSDFTHLYREDGQIKEYTATLDQIVPAESSTDPIPESPIEKQISTLNNRITAITPYTSTKKAYFGEVEKVFYGVPQGIMTVQMDNDFTVQRIEDRVYVRFERLTEAKDITLIVQ